MTEIEHTPGPWTVENSRARSLMVATKEFVVAQVLFAGIEPEEVDRANACLIAAAPDLLAFAQWVSESPLCHVMTACERDRLNALISRAAITAGERTNAKD